jgi:hypothetical protein
VWVWVAALVAAGLLLVWTGSERDRPPATGAGDLPAVAANAPASMAPPEPDAAAQEVEDASEGMYDASAAAWSQVDLDEVRAALPDNSYWRRSAPTDDPQLLAQREEDRAYWEAEYGKVLSNTATEEQVRDYYAHQRMVSSDAIEFSTHLLEHYGDVLPERDVGMLQLAMKLHMAKLEELPRNLQAALERRDDHEQRRNEWLEQQRAFGDVASDAAEAD